MILTAMLLVSAGLAPVHVCVASGDKRSEPLTRALVERTLDTMEALKAVGLLEGNSLDTPDHATRMAAITHKHGFGSALAFATSVHRILQAYASLTLGELDGASTMQAYYDRARSDIEASPDMSEQQKARMLKRLETYLAMLKDFSKGGAGVDVIRPYSDRIARIIGSSG